MQAHLEDWAGHLTGLLVTPLELFNRQAGPVII